MAVAGTAVRAVHVQVVGNEVVANWGTMQASECFRVPQAMMRLERGQSVWVRGSDVIALKQALAEQEVKW